MAIAAATKRKFEPAEKVEVWPLSDITPYERNPRTHPKHQIELLARLMAEHGVDQPIVVDEKGIIIKGHGRLLAAKFGGMSTFPVVVKKGLTENQKRAERMADNQVALLAGWDTELMRLEVGELRMANYDMSMLGFDNDQLAEFSDLLPRLPDADRGALLALVDITMDDPKHVVEIGDHYILAKRHHLVVDSVISGWKTWAPLLKGDSLFCPYPGVFVPFSARADKNDLVMVQPDKYIAGHILDRYAEVKGEKMVTKS